MDLNIRKEVAALKRMTVNELRAKLRRGLRRATRPNNKLAHRTHRLAAASTGRGRPVRAGPPTGRRTGQRCRPPPRPPKPPTSPPRPESRDNGPVPRPGRRPSAAARHHHHPQVQGPTLAGPGFGGWLRVRGPGLQFAVAPWRRRLPAPTAMAITSFALSGQGAER